MDDFQPAERPYPSPSIQRRTGEIWKARLGLGLVVALTLVSSAVLFRVAGLGVAAAVSPFQAAPTSTPLGGARAVTSSITPTVLPSPGVSGTPSSQTPVPGQLGNATPVNPSAGALAGTTPTRSPVLAASATATTVRASREHVVASGDTLGAIATKYATNVETLVRLNDFKDKNQTLNIGQKIKIP